MNGINQSQCVQTHHCTNVKCGANCTAHYTQPMACDTVQISAKTYEKVKKPGLFKSLGSGIWHTIKTAIPFVGCYAAGKIENEHDDIMDEMKYGNAHKMNDNKKGVIKTTIGGFVNQVVYAIPLYGTYKLGKTAVENKQTLEKINNNDHTKETKEPGLFKSYWKGLVKKIGLAIPVVNLYIMGRDIKTQERIAESLAKTEGQ